MEKRKCFKFRGYKVNLLICNILFIQGLNFSGLVYLYSCSVWYEINVTGCHLPFYF